MRWDRAGPARSSAAAAVKMSRVNRHAYVVAVRPLDDLERRARRANRAPAKAQELEGELDAVSGCDALRSRSTLTYSATTSAHGMLRSGVGWNDHHGRQPTAWAILLNTWQRDCIWPYSLPRKR